jgi:hypothetical protein
MKEIISHPNHKEFHQWTKHAVFESTAMAINYVRETHGEEFLRENPSMISDAREAHSRIYSAHVISDTINKK